MKRTFALLLSVMMALAVTACGKDDNAATSGAGSGSAGSSVNDGAGSSVNGGSGSGVLDDGNRVDDGAPGTDAGAADDSMTGLKNGDAGAPDSSNDLTGSTSVPQRGTLEGATYGQMLRNGQVHDRDGYLLDGENAVTPGTAR